jgi:hypothetical protein
MRSYATVIGVNLLLFISIMMVVELAVRFFLTPNQPFDKRALSNVSYEPSGLVLKNALPDQVVYAIEGGVAQTDKPMFRFNSDGLRNPAIQPKKEGEVRILIFGGSHVFDLNSYDHQGNPGFPRLIEDSLRRAGRNVTVINAGVPSANSLELAGKLLYDFPRYQPDIVIFNSTWNDLKWIVKAKNRQIIRTKPFAMSKNPLLEPMNNWDHLLGFSVVYRKIRDAWYRNQLKGVLLHREDQTEAGRIENAKAETTEFTNADEGILVYARILRSFVSNTRLIGARPVIAMEERFPASNMTDQQMSRISYSMIEGLKNHEDLLQLFVKCDSVLQRVAGEYQVPLIDLRAEMQGQSRFFDDHIHTTPEGSRYIASRYTAILPSIIDEKSLKVGQGGLKP